MIQLGSNNSKRDNEGQSHRSWDSGIYKRNIDDDTESWVRKTVVSETDLRSYWALKDRERPPSVT